MKNSLNNLNEIFSEFAILFLRQQKEVEVREGRRGGGREEEEVGGGPTLFSLCQLFRMPRSSLALKKWKRSLCYSHSFRNNLIRDLHVLKLLGTLNVRGHPCI